MQFLLYKHNSTVPMYPHKIENMSDIMSNATGSIIVFAETGPVSGKVILNMYATPYEKKIVIKGRKNKSALEMLYFVISENLRLAICSSFRESNQIPIIFFYHFPLFLFFFLISQIPPPQGKEPKVVPKWTIESKG